MMRDEYLLINDPGAFAPDLFDISP